MSQAKPNKDLLGKGIRSLLQNIDADLKNTSGELKSGVVEQATGVVRVPIEQIEVILQIPCDPHPEIPQSNWCARRHRGQAF